MAGDWIKMRTALAHDPAVIAIALDLDKSEFEIVGMLHHIWSWADSQSQDGHIKRVTEKWLDRFVHCDGFSKSLESAKWLVIGSDGIEFPNFGKHNGESAKKRAEAAERKRISRENSGKLGIENVTQMSQKTCDESVTREEKRREEIKDQEHCDQQAESPRQSVKIPYDEILDAFKLKLPSFPQPRRPLDEDRRKSVRLLWTQKEDQGSVDFFSRYFGYIAKSDFLMGETGWTSCNFDWVFKPKNFRKIIEGTYHKEQQDA